MALLPCGLQCEPHIMICIVPAVSSKLLVSGNRFSPAACPVSNLLTLNRLTLQALISQGLSTCNACWFVGSCSCVSSRLCFYTLLADPFFPASAFVAAAVRRLFPVLRLLPVSCRNYVFISVSACAHWLSAPWRGQLLSRVSCH